MPPDFNRYREVSRQVRQIYARHTDLIEPLSLDEAYLDVTVNKGGLPSATEVAQVIRHQIRQETGLTASAGVAPNKFLAKIASDWNKPDGLFVIRPSKVLEFLAPLPVRKVPGVGKVTQARLEQLGIQTVGDLATHEVQELEHYFGRYGRRLYELARGIDEREVDADQQVQQVSAETTFSEDVRLEALGEAIDRMAGKVWDQALKKGALGRTVVLKLKTDRFRILTRSLTSANPPSSAEELATIARLLCDRGPAATDAVPAGRRRHEQLRRSPGTVPPARSLRRRFQSAATQPETVPSNLGQCFQPETVPPDGAPIGATRSRLCRSVVAPLGKRVALRGYNLLLTCCDSAVMSARPASDCFSSAMTLPIAGAPVTPCAATSASAASMAAATSSGVAACGRNSCSTASSAFSCSAVSVRPACSKAAMDSRRCLTCFSMMAVISASFRSRRSSTSFCLTAASRNRSVVRRSEALARMASFDGIGESGLERSGAHG